MARSNLLDFACYTKPDYQVSWHHRLVAEKLDAFVSGRIKRLMLFMPPRHGKSELVSRRLPAFIFGRNPDAQIIACSYGADLAGALNRDVQAIIDGPEYQSLFPETRLYGANVRTVGYGSYLRNSDVFEVVNHYGRYRSAGVGGPITGQGFNYGIIDDPIKNREEANSPTYREKLYQWFTGVFYNRQEKDASILLTVTRWHENDLAGRLLEMASNNPDADQWEVLSLSALAEAPQPPDPRAEGEPLWPQKYSLQQMQTMRATMGPYSWAALYQQRPAPLEGGLFSIAMFEAEGFRVKAPARDTLKRVVVAIDPATTANEGSDETGIIVAGTTYDGSGYVLQDLSGRYTPNEWAYKAIGAYEHWGADRVIAEVNQGGQMVEHTLRTVRPSIPVKTIHASRGKVARAEPVAALYEQGKVRHAGNFTALEDQLVSWAVGDPSPDRLDALVYALTELMLQGKVITSA